MDTMDAKLIRQSLRLTQSRGGINPKVVGTIPPTVM